ncbi:hypothetical protein KHA80_06205 [Anaerobacillus sp. HL2]|nr:hypothetical protein KHA80_06205 [Anaerobacillus sp. HL2]
MQKTSEQRTALEKSTVKEFILFFMLIKVPVGQLHDQVINSIANSVRLLTVDQVHEKIAASLKNEVTDLQKDLKELETALGNYAIKQSKIKIRLQEVMKAKLDKALSVH